MMRRVGAAGSLRPDLYNRELIRVAAEVVPDGTLPGLTPWSEEESLAIYVQDILDTLGKLTNDPTANGCGGGSLGFRGVRA